MDTIEASALYDLADHMVGMSGAEFGLRLFQDSILGFWWESFTLDFT